MHRSTRIFVVMSCFVLLILTGIVPSLTAVTVQKTQNTTSQTADIIPASSERIKQNVKSSQQPIQTPKYDYLTNCATFTQKILGSECLGATIHTVYTKGGSTVEKDTPVKIFKSTTVDVDDSGGEDLKAFVELKLDHVKTKIGLQVSAQLERLNQNMADEALESYLKITIPSLFKKYCNKREIKIGYTSMDGEQIPSMVRTYFTFVPYIPFIQPYCPEIKYGLEHEGGDGNKIALVLDYIMHKSDFSINRRFAVEFDPIISVSHHFDPGKSDDVWSLAFERTASETSKVTYFYEYEKLVQHKRVSLTFDKLPRTMSFDLEITPLSSEGGSFVYEASREFDVMFSIESNQFDDKCPCILLQSMPKRIEASWKPGFNGGKFEFSMSRGIERIILCDSLSNPSMSLKIENLPRSGGAYWNFGASGNLEIESENERNLRASFNWKYKDQWNMTIFLEHTPGSIDLSWNLPKMQGEGYFHIHSDTTTRVGITVFSDEWGVETMLTVQPRDITLTWLISQQGYLTIDSKNEPVAATTLAVMKDDLRIDVTVGLWKTKDFKISWTLHPFKVEWSGYAKVVDSISLGVTKGANSFDITGSFELSKEKGHVDHNSKTNVTININNLKNSVFTVDSKLHLAGKHQLSLAWNKGKTGYFSIDTQRERISDVEIIISDSNAFGVNMGATRVRANNFNASWDFDGIPDIDLDGDIDYDGDLHLSIYLFGSWYDLF